MAASLDEEQQNHAVTLTVDDSRRLVSSQSVQVRVDDAVSSNTSLLDSFIRDESGRLRSIRAREEDWMTHSLEMYKDKYQGRIPKENKLPAKVRNFYKNQDKLIDEFLEIEERLYGQEPTINYDKRKQRALTVGKRLAKLTVFCNVLLLVGKGVAVYLSVSLSVISSLVDSFVDICTSVIIWWTNRVVTKRNIYRYPQGRTRLEPLAIVILSALMGSAALQIIRESIQDIIQMANGKSKGPNIDSATLSLVGATVIVKFILFIVCMVYGRKLKRYTKTVLFFAQDHRNDVLTNTMVLISTLITRYYPPAMYSDPVGALLIAIYILVGWWKTGRDHVRSLSGITAEPKIIQKLTFICLNHDRKIKGIDTVRAFYHGSNTFVEVDIVLPGSMKLREAHDIGESLQVKLETLDEVERAFVHIDYESNHDPRSEHKQV